MKWNKNLEAKVIKKYYGRQINNRGFNRFGYNAIVRNRPTEIRPIRKGSRYRIEQTAHRQLCVDGGLYIFVNNQMDSRILTGQQVTKIIGKNKWLSDGKKAKGNRPRLYPHKFLYAVQVFNR